MNIRFLDAGTLDYGDLSFKPLERRGNLIRHRLTPAGSVARRARGSRVLIVNKCLITEAVLRASPSVRLICVAATGTNNVDLAAAQKHGVAVANVRGYSTESVTQLTFGMILGLTMGLREYWVRTPARWPRSPFFTMPIGVFGELSGKTLGIVGYGTIGRRVAEVARAFGMKILVAKLPGRNYSGRPRVSRCSLSELSKKSDYISLHAALTPRTQNIIDAEFIDGMKPSAYLINMARGPLWDIDALWRAVKSKRIAGAATDVWSVEPPTSRHPLMTSSRVLLTPHIGWASREARQRLIDETAANIAAFESGKTRNRVV